MNKRILFSGIIFCFFSFLTPCHSYYVSPRGYFIGEVGHATDWILANEIGSFLRKEGVGSVADFGCGNGDYVSLLLHSNINAVGFDGNPITKDLSDGICYVQDLSVSFDFGIQSDWVISLETGQYLPKEYEGVFIDNLIRHARSGLILSWASEEQAGFNYLNPQSNNYIKNLLSKRGWRADESAEILLRTSCSIPWYKKNIMVFRAPQKENSKNFKE